MAVMTLQCREDNRRAWGYAESDGNGLALLLSAEPLYIRKGGGSLELGEERFLGDGGGGEIQAQLPLTNPEVEAVAS